MTSIEAWDEVNEKAHEVTFRIDRILRLPNRQPLTPIWEAFVLRMLLPIHEVDLQEYKAGNFHISAERVARRQRSLEVHPFNFSDEVINISRATKLLKAIQYLLSLSTHAGAHLWPVWCPQDAASLVEAVKKEREEIDTLGYVDLSAAGEQHERGEHHGADEQDRGKGYSGEKDKNGGSRAGDNETSSHNEPSPKRKRSHSAAGSH